MTGQTTLVIPCSGAKLEMAARAADLYTGSFFSLARQAAEYCEQTAGWSWAILSAKYGLVRPWQLLEPYNVTMTDANSVSDELLHHTVLMTMPSENHSWVLCLPKAYRQRIEATLGQFDGSHTVDVFAGCRGIGEQRGRLAKLRSSTAEQLDSMLGMAHA